MQLKEKSKAESGDGLTIYLPTKYNSKGLEWRQSKGRRDTLEEVNAG